jgi:hypothetical protein
MGVPSGHPARDADLAVDLPAALLQLRLTHRSVLPRTPRLAIETKCPSIRRAHFHGRMTCGSVADGRNTIAHVPPRPRLCRRKAFDVTTMCVCSQGTYSATASFIGGSLHNFALVVSQQRHPARQEPGPDSVFHRRGYNRRISIEGHRSITVHRQSHELRLAGEGTQ